MKTAHDIILAPVITENSMAGIADKKYTFKVATDATKVEIAQAVEELFGVKVAKVNTMKKNAGRNSYGRITVRHRGGGNRTKYRIIDFKRHKTDAPPPSRLSSTIRTAAHSSLWSSTPTARSATSLLPMGLKVGDMVIPPVCRHQARQLPALREHPRWYHHPQHRAVSRQAALSWFVPLATWLS